MKKGNELGFVACMVFGGYLIGIFAVESDALLAAQRELNQGRKAASSLVTNLPRWSRIRYALD